MTASVSIRGRHIARNSVINLVGQGLPLVVAIFTTPVVFHGLGVERFGLLALVLVAVGYFGVLEFGLGRAVTKFMAESLGRGDHARVPAIVWTGAIAQGALGVLGGGLLVTITPVLVERLLHVSPAYAGGARLSFEVLAVSLPAVLMVSSFRGALEAAQRFDLVNAVGTPFNLATPLVLVAGARLGWDLPRIVTLLVILRWCALVAYYWSCASVFPLLRRLPRGHLGELRTLLGFGGWVTVSSVVTPVFLYLDRFIIGALLAVSAVGFYALPYDVITRLWILPASIAMSLFPAFSSLGAANPEDTARFYLKAQKTLVLLVAPVALGLIWFGGDVLRLWLGDSVAARSTLVFQTLAFGATVGCLAPISGTLLQSRGRPDIVAKLYLFVHLPMTAVLAWFLIRALGLEGAALSTALRTSIDSAILVLWSARSIRPIPSADAFGLPTMGMLCVLTTLTCVGLAAVGVLAVDPRVPLTLGSVAGVAVWYRFLGRLDTPPVRRESGYVRQPVKA